MRTIVFAMAAAVVLAGTALGGARQAATVAMPNDPGQRKLWESWGFSDAIIVDNTVYLSGVVVMTKAGDADLEAAYSRTFEGIGSILKQTGASWDDVVDITSFHTDLKTQMPAIVAVKNRFVKAPFPAWTAIQVVRLIPDNGVTEIKIVAKLPPKPSKL